MACYVLKVDSYDGDTTSREQMTWSELSALHTLKALYAIVLINEDGAILIDDGYRSRSEALKAWPEAK